MSFPINVLPQNLSPYFYFVTHFGYCDDGDGARGVMRYRSHDLQSVISDGRMSALAICAIFLETVCPLCMKNLFYYIEYKRMTEGCAFPGVAVITGAAGRGNHFLQYSSEWK
jgi:hypothetical protein